MKNIKIPSSIFLSEINFLVIIKNYNLRKDENCRIRVILIIDYFYKYFSK